MNIIVEDSSPRWKSNWVAMALVGFLVGVAVTVRFDQTPESLAAPNVPLKPDRGALDLQESFNRVAEEVGKSVVHITTKVRVRGQVWDPYEDFFGDFFGGPRRRRGPQFREYEYEGGIGTGMVIRPDGYILTNRHVIEPFLQADQGEIKVTITMNGKKKTYKGELKGYRSHPDLAIVKIEAGEKLPFVTLGDSEKVRVGEWAIAIGNPFGYDNTVTVGIVSAKYRELRAEGGSKLRNLIQSDAAINPGNSGGPLANIYGEIIGVNVAIASGGAAQSAGIGFAIPANDVKAVLEDLIKGKTTESPMPWMGVSLGEVDEEEDGVKEGAVIRGVIEESPADLAGFREGDVMLSVDGKIVKNPEEAIEEIQRHQPGDKVKVRFLRRGKELTKEVKVAAAPETPSGRSPNRQRTFRWP